jgi:hypothetical protein
MTNPRVDRSRVELLLGEKKKFGEIWLASASPVPVDGSARSPLVIGLSTSIHHHGDE